MKEELTRPHESGLWFAVPSKGLTMFLGWWKGFKVESSRVVFDFRLGPLLAVELNSANDCSLCSLSLERA